MEIAKYETPKRKKKRSSLILKVGFIFLLSIMAISIAANFVLLSEAKDEEAALEAQVAYYEEEIEDLQNKMLDENLDEVVEAIAREEYGLLQDGETVYSSENF